MNVETNNNIKMKSSITKQKQQNQQSKKSIIPQEIKNLIAGGIAGMIAKTIVAPIDRIKILYQVSSTPFHLKDVPIVISRIIQEEGLIALWKGNTATMIRVFPYAGIQFMIFNKLKSYSYRDDDDYHDDDGCIEDKRSNNINNNKNENKINNNVHRGNMTPIESLLAGSTAGAVSVLFTYPLDLTRAQLAVLKKQKLKKNDGFVKVFRTNYTKFVSFELEIAFVL